MSLTGTAMDATRFQPNVANHSCFLSAEHACHFILGTRPQNALRSQAIRSSLKKQSTAFGVIINIYLSDIKFLFLHVSDDVFFLIHFTPNPYLRVSVCFAFFLNVVVFAFPLFYVFYR